MTQNEWYILAAIHYLAEQAYGVPIRKQVEKQSKHITSIGSIYVTLDELERKSWVVSKLSDPTPERGYRPKKFWALTELGLEQLRQFKMVSVAT